MVTGSGSCSPSVTSAAGTATRLELLQDAIGHEQYHRGQLTVYERLLGLVPALYVLLERRGAVESAGSSAMEIGLEPLRHPI